MHPYEELEKRVGIAGIPAGPVTPNVARPHARQSLDSPTCRFQPLPDPEDEPHGDGVDEILSVTAWAYRNGARSEGTRKAYRTDFEHFERWCKENGLLALPASPETVGYYLAAHGDQSGTEESIGLAIATLERRLVSIAHAHKSAKLDIPTKAPSVRELLQGIRREAALYGRGAPKKAIPLLTEDMRAIITALDTETMQGKRDKALLLLEWTGAFRAGEVGTIHVADMQYTPRGYLITLRKSKTDQTGQGQRVAIPMNKKNPAFCPVVALKEWMLAAAIRSGAVIRPVNRHGQPGKNGITRDGINDIVKRVVVAAGYDPEGYSSHSMRGGFVTSAALEGASDAASMAHGRWKSKRVYLGYVQVAELFNNNPANLVGL